MKTEPNDCVSPIGNHTQHQAKYGLTKREYFVAMAMQGMLSSDDFACSEPEFVSNLAVEQADALIAELNK